MDGSSPQTQEFSSEALHLGPSLTNEEFDDPHSQAWIAFARADSLSSFCQNWLTLLCQFIPNATGGLLLWRDSTRDACRPKGMWPRASKKLLRLEGSAKKVIQGKAPCLIHADSDQNRWEVGFPLEVDSQLVGAVVIEVLAGSDRELQRIRRQIYWATAWIEVVVRREQLAERNAVCARLQQVLALVGTACSSERFSEAASALVTELATQFSCDRVSVGFIRRDHVRVMALSHSTNLTKETNLLYSIGKAMDESLDQGHTLVWPPLAHYGDGGLLVAHEELTRVTGSGAVCTVPLHVDTQAVGALTFERSVDRPFDVSEIERCEAVGALAGPILESRRREDRWLITKALDSFWTFLQHLVGPHHVALKLGAVMLVTLLAFALLVHGDYKVSAKATLEPVKLQAIVAPFDAYITAADHRAGDLVKAGELLARLDDRELQLEQSKLIGRVEETRREYKKALASHELAKANIALAQLKQIQAQLNLISERLSHTELTAPYAGVVVSGDLSQKLGAPVEQGEVLFEVAPLHDYRLDIQVDERDITDIAVGQTGQLLLTALPDTQLSFTVDAITPVSEAKEGRNYFRVEAHLDETVSVLRPAMEGTAKVNVDERLLVWIWFHDVGDWIKLTLWKWLP